MPYADSPQRMAQLIDQLRLRLDCALELSLDAQEHLASGKTDAIETGIARLETVAQEFKLLAEEYHRLPESEPPDDERLIRAKHELADAVTRVARSSAVAGGLLERMIQVSRGRFALFSSANDGTYQRDGRGSEFHGRGLRLKEWV